MKIFYTILALAINVFLGYGQQQVSYLQYTHNSLSINPAFAGYYSTPAISFSGGTQFSGYEGGQKSALVSVQGPVRGKKIGLGATISSDKIGVSRNTRIVGSYAYNLISRNKNSYTNWGFEPHVLSLGIQAGTVIYNERLSELYAPNDPRFETDVQEVVPLLGFGAYYSKGGGYVGFSIPQLLGSYISENVEIRNHYYLTGGKSFDVSAKSRMKFSGMMKYVHGAPVQFDFNSAINWSDKVEVGVGYTTLSTVNMTMLYNIQETLQIAYYFGLPVHDNVTINASRHEVMLNLLISKIAPR
ncbi:PorP/SprF family type IX secretion system membrane protein [Marinigracilibium pacificum]|uniref:PorP/SprF family type IX secretion system membrane protein n=1 Tax=Marinigracilibium pacificum TaxID=2729599 RepID=A0A848J312_9BACT|nr:PorP/SprF family type IX secretion system membrane protein [Marinigracilibium pacificum]NMM48729.1 PorP/SprF family type IX secretion system membrane protein [Marinigracilibium pacificum]